MSAMIGNLLKTAKNKVGEYFLLDRNSLIHICILSIMYNVILVEGLHTFYYYFILMAFIDFVYYFFGYALFDTETVISHGYNYSAYFNDTLYGEGVDYGFNYYKGDYTKSREQAQTDKFMHAWNQLELKEGMSVIDIGCGCGDWLSWLANRGIKVVGVNITPAQVSVCQKRGLKVHCLNWKDIDSNKELKAELYGQFDAVTFWDTAEHYVPSKYRDNEIEKNHIYQNMFGLANKLLKDNRGKVLVTCLHMKQKWGLWRKFYCYLLDKFHSGCYPSYEKDEIVVNGKVKDFALVSREDVTDDYYMTSKLEKTHFGRHIFKWTKKRLMVMLWNTIVDPNWFQRLIWFKCEAWMWQFDPKDINNSDMLHWWLLFEKNPYKIIVTPPQ